MNKSVINALNILNLFTDHEDQLSLSEISIKVGMSKPTVYRLLSSLEYCGFLAKVIHSKQDVSYRLGLKLLELGNIVAEQLDLRRIALPHMKRLNSVIDEIVLLVVLDGDGATYIEKVESRHPLRLYARVGRNSPLYLGSGPKLLFAHMPEEEREEVIRNLELHPRTENTLVDKEQLRIELKKINEEGFSTSHGEQDPGIKGFSFPIRDYKGDVVAALAASIPFNRYQRENDDFIKGKIKTAAKQISSDLGFKD